MKQEHVGWFYSMKVVADRPYPSPCPGCVHGLILPSLLAAADFLDIARKSAVFQKLPFGLQMSC